VLKFRLHAGKPLLRRNEIPVGYGMLYLAQRITGRSRYSTKVRQVIDFMVFYGWQFTLANSRIAIASLLRSFASGPASLPSRFGGKDSYGDCHAR
jgi:hypothetical protein